MRIPEPRFFSALATWQTVHIRAGILVALTLVIQPVAAEGNIVLSRDGKATCTIVSPPDALALERLAVRELADHLEQVVGDRPGVGVQPRSGTTIYVGRSEEIDRLVGDVDFAALGTDGIVVRTVGEDLVITGGRPRGVIFAVQTFLQDVVGVRWWAPDATEMPTIPTLVIRDLNIIYRPSFELRHFRTGPLNDPTFALRMRHNGHVIGYDTADHSIGKLLSPHEHFVDHPEWFMYTPEDDPTTGEYSFDSVLANLTQWGPPEWYDVAVKTRRLPSQPCTSSRGALEETTRAVLHKLKQDYPKWQYQPKIVLVTQSNGVSWCKCDACLATTQRESSVSGTWIEFVNAIAERVEKDYPDVKVATMAFVYTEKPPAHVKPRPNVLVYSIPVTSNRKLPLTAVTEGEWVKKWCEIARHVYIWEHEPNFRFPIEPHPNHFAIAENIKFFAQHGVEGLMIEAKGGNVSELQKLRAYVWCQLMWNPQQDVRQLMNEFLRGYYGDAGPFLMQWIDLQHRLAQNAKDFVLSAYTPSTAGWLRLDDLNLAMLLFDAALQAVQGNTRLENRVRHARLSVEVVWIKRYRELRAEATERGLPFLGPDDPHSALERIARDEFKLQWIQLPQYIEKLRAALSSEVPR